MSTAIDNDELDIHTQLADMTQGMYEDFGDARNKLNGGMDVDVPAIKHYGNTLRAAIEVGMINTYDVKQVRELKPKIVKWIYEKIVIHMSESLALPPPSSSEQLMQPREKDNPQGS